MRPAEAVAQIALTAEQIRSEVKRDYATNDQMSQVTETLFYPCRTVRKQLHMDGH